VYGDFSPTLYRVNRKARRRKGDLKPQALNYLIDEDMQKGSETYPSNLMFSGPCIIVITEE